MKSYKSLFLLLALMFAVFPAFAQEAVNPCANVPEATRGKTQSETTTILELCRGSANTVTIGNVSVPQPEEVSEWSVAAKGIAEAIGIAAKGLGIAVNEFLNSPAGVLVAFILTVKYAGGVIIGVPFVVFSILVWLYALRKLIVKTVSYENVPIFWGMLTMRRKTAVNFHDNENSEGAIVLLVLGIALLFVDLIVCLNV